MMGGAAGFFVSTLRFDMELTGPRGLTRLAMEIPSLHSAYSAKELLLAKT